ncbi:MAG: hypothetical protein M1825_005614 [Sarcosagium campestre]|nr:MAG: hypothetical protein M1825_005614 [Sarcosagium campestre]
MVLQFLSKYAGEAYAAWLASSITCCASYVKHEDEDAGSHSYREEKTMEICHQQPHLIPAPRPEPGHQRYGSRSSMHPSQWRARSRSVISHASSRGSVYVRRRTKSTVSRRPTIGAPSDFRRVENYQTRSTGRFRPLELSIYLPQNRLSPLPTFDHPPGEEPAELERPAQARILPRTNSIFSNASDFTIPRKPVAPATDLRIPDYGRQSFDARSMLSTQGSEWVSHPLRPRPSLPESLSTQELISALESRLPKPPAAMRTRSSSDLTSSMYRRDSDSHRRPFITSDERNEIDGRITDIGTIQEERCSPLGDRFARDPLGLGMPTSSSSSYTPRPSTPSKAAFDMARELSPRAASPITPPEPRRSLSRVSKWLFPAAGDASEEDEALPPPPPFFPGAGGRHMTRASTESTMSTLPTLDRSPSEATIVSPQSSPGRTTPIRHRTFGHVEATKARKVSDEMPLHEPGALDQSDALRLWNRPSVGVAF